jgi:hypothetical protein
MDRSAESFALDISSPDFVRILHGDSFDVTAHPDRQPKALAFERENGWWVADALAAVALGQESDVARTYGADRLRAFCPEPEHSPWVVLQNERPPEVEHGGVVRLEMSRPLARRLALDLEGLPFGRAQNLLPGTADADLIAIEAGLASSDPEEVYDAVIDIGRQGRRQLAPLVAPHLSSEVDFLREAAIKSLVFYLQLPEHVEAAVRLMEADEDEDVRAAAATGLGEFARSDLGLLRRLLAVALEVEEQDLVRAAAFRSALVAAAADNSSGLGEHLLPDFEQRADWGSLARALRSRGIDVPAGVDARL